MSLFHNCSESHQSIPQLFWVTSVYSTTPTYVRHAVILLSNLCFFSSKLPLSFSTSNQQRKRISLLSLACHMPHPPHTPSLNHSNIQREVGDKILSTLLCNFVLPPLTSSFLSQVFPSAFRSYWLKHLEKENDNNIRKCWSFAFHLSAAKTLYKQIFILRDLTNAPEPDFFVCLHLQHKWSRRWLIQDTSTSYSASGSVGRNVKLTITLIPIFKWYHLTPAFTVYYVTFI
jgi:hypothetical protein